MESPEPAPVNHAVASQGLPGGWGSVGLGTMVFTSSPVTLTSDVRETAEQDGVTDSWWEAGSE